MDFVFGPAEARNAGERGAGVVDVNIAPLREEAPLSHSTAQLHLDIWNADVGMSYEILQNRADSLAYAAGLCWQDRYRELRIDCHPA